MRMPPRSEQRHGGGALGRGGADAVAQPADGCYVLKTVRSGTRRRLQPACTSALVNVCKGEPYAAQMAASWLI